MKFVLTFEVGGSKSLIITLPHEIDRRDTSEGTQQRESSNLTLNDEVTALNSFVKQSMHVDK